MNLKDFISNRDKPPELYWSLVIEKDWVQSGIWHITESAAEMVAVSPPAAWSGEQELVGACDAALSSSIAKLPENFSEPNKTVFGVQSDWVKDGEIKDEHLAKIKKVCTELSLTPVGFVVLPEAIAHLYKSEEGSPLSGIIIGLGNDTLEITVFKLGNLAGTTSVARSVSFTEDVLEGLSRFEGASPLPSRFIVYDGKGGELEEAKEELMKPIWETHEKIKFLHTPKAEILSSDRKVLATSLAGANEIANVSQVNPVAGMQSEENLPPEDELENVVEPVEETSPEDLGFMLEKDVTKEVQEIKEPQIHIPEPVIKHQTQINHPKINSDYLQKTRNLLHNFSSKIKLPPSNPNTSGGNFVYLILVIIVLAVIGGGAYLFFVPKAQVTVFVSPKTYQEELNLSFSTDGQFDETRAIVPGTLVTHEASGDKTKTTTGTKLVGEKAGGSVQIANGNGNPIKLATGTILLSSGGLRFVTNTEASVSGQLIPGSPGTATLAVTAADIGAQYNLAKGEVFKVGAFDKSQVAATSQADFSGGSSQQIQAVSADDQKKLEQDLKNELSETVMNELQNKAAEGTVFVNSLSDLSVTSENFDHKTGDVADTLKLALTVSGTGIAADKEKLLKYAAGSLQNKIPQGYGLRNSQIGFKFTFVGKKDGLLNYNVNINANFLPQVDNDELNKKIAGKSKRVVEEYLNSVPGFSRAEVDLEPTLPPFLQYLPRIVKNINIVITAER